MTEEDRIESVKNNGEHLKSFKEENRTYEVCLAAVSHDGNALIHVPLRHRSYEMYFNACSNAGIMLRVVPNEQKDEKLCMAAVSSDGMSLSYVPEEMKTAKLCQLAVHKNAAAIQFVPSTMVTAAFCAQIMCESGNNNLIPYIPAEMKKAPFYESLVQIKPDVFFYIPKKYRTVKLCKMAIKGLGYGSVAEAVKANDRIFGYLNVALLNHDTCLAYVESHPEITDKYLVSRTEQPIEKVLITEDICECVLKYNGRLLQYVPQNVITDNLCKIAVSNDYYALNYVPAEKLTAEICNLAFQQDVSAICYIPEKYIDYEKCLAAVTHYGGFLSYVPEQMRTREVCDAALQSDMDSLIYVPQKYVSREMIIDALDVGKPFVYTLIHHIPEDYWDEEIFQSVFEHLGIYSSGISNVPEHKLTYEMCLSNVKYTAYAILEVPERYQTAEIYREAARSLGNLGYPRDWKIIERIPSIWKTDDFYSEARKYASIECIQHLPSDEKREPLFTIKDGLLTGFRANGCLDITIPSSVKNVGHCVFWGGEIERVVTSEGVETFEELSFSKCNSIKQLCISSTVRALPIGSFRDELSGLCEFVVAESNPLFASIDGVLYNKSITELIRCPQNFSSSEFVVPDSVRVIGEHAFYGCKNICKICLPDHELEIRSFAFAYCCRLKKVNLPGNMVSIPYGLFLNSAIETITLPPMLEELGSCSFRYSKLKAIELPNGIRSIGGYAFQPCPLTKIRIPKSVIEPILENTFSSAEIECEIELIPGGLLLFGTDTKSLKQFTYARSKKNLPMGDEDYLELIANKTLLRKHFAFAAFLRSFVYDNDLTPEIKELYIGIVKSQKKRLLDYFASNNYDEYIRIMLAQKLVTKKDVLVTLEHIATE